jgi:biopolymer transport protein ExbB
LPVAAAFNEGWLGMYYLLAQAAGTVVPAATGPIASGPIASGTAAVAAATPSGTAAAVNAAVDAATATGAAEAAPTFLEEMLKTGALGYMWDGGFFMWPIFIMGILAFGVIIERYRTLKMLSTDTNQLRRDVLELLQADRVEDALELCNKEQGPVAAILGTGLRKLLVLRKLNYDPAQVQEQVEKAMDDYGVHVTAALEAHLPILATVSSVAPMIGFLGTVQGMVISFAEIVAQHGKVDIILAAAGGIMTALLTTVLGLIVGIPAFTAFNYFTSLINNFVLDVEGSASELIDAVTMQTVIDRESAPEALETT